MTTGQPKLAERSGAREKLFEVGTPYFWHVLNDCARAFEVMVRGQKIAVFFKLLLCEGEKRGEDKRKQGKGYKQLLKHPQSEGYVRELWML